MLNQKDSRYYLLGLQFVKITSHILLLMGPISVRRGTVNYTVPCIGRPSCERIRIQWSDILRMTSGCKATDTLPVSPEAMTLGLAAFTHTHTHKKWKMSTKTWQYRPGSNCESSWLYKVVKWECASGCYNVYELFFRSWSIVLLWGTSFNEYSTETRQWLMTLLTVMNLC